MLTTSRIKRSWYNLGRHFTSNGRLVKNRSRVLTALVAKFTTCSHPASNIVFMMVLLIGIVYLFPFIDVVSHSMSGRLAIINTMFDAGCEQVVNFANRAVNTLDLFFTNRPSLVNKCLPLPGLSDHDVVLVDTNITPARHSRRIFRLHQGWLYLVEVCLDGTCFLRLSRQMVLKSDHRLFIGVFISEQSPKRM
jgi:hypothetical protein